MANRRTKLYPSTQNFQHVGETVSLDVFMNYLTSLRLKLTSDERESATISGNVEIWYDKYLSEQEIADARNAIFSGVMLEAINAGKPLTVEAMRDALARAQSV